MQHQHVYVVEADLLSPRCGADPGVERNSEERGGAEVGRGELAGQQAADTGDLGGGDAEGAGQERVGHRWQRPAEAGTHGGGARRTAGGQLLPGREQAAQVGHRGLSTAARGAVGDGGEQPALFAGGGQDVRGQIQGWNTGT
ncbi:hypothetical protein ABT097_16210 [Streptomyces sp. NPDC002225]|uniref:hypothetical protein n=1 Tax=Streptomyces sp. NPDC002225 TaxID=3154413 RepID=UPI00332736B1